MPEKCIACGLCQTLSDAFDYDDEGIVLFSQEPKALTKTFPDQESLARAVKSCPTKALTLLDG